MIPVYVASKISHAPFLRGLRTTWKDQGIDVCSRWLDQAKLEDQATPGDFSIFWRVDRDDVAKSVALVLYAREGDHLRGALVEAGMAIAFDILVVCVGDHPDFGTWQHHPGVVKAATLEHAREMIIRLFGGTR